MDYEITAEELKRKLDSKDEFTLLDCREGWEFQAAQIAGSMHIPMGEIPMRAGSELDPDAHIVVVCHHGVRSMNVAVWLRKQGYENAQSLRGGIDHWSRSIDPKVPTY